MMDVRREKRGAREIGRLVFVGGDWVLVGAGEGCLEVGLRLNGRILCSTIVVASRNKAGFAKSKECKHPPRVEIVHSLAKYLIVKEKACYTNSIKTKLRL